MCRIPYGGCLECQLPGCAHLGSGGPGLPCGPEPAPSGCPSPPHCSPEAWGCHAAPTLLLTKSMHYLAGVPILLMPGMQRALQNIAAVDNAAYMHASAGNPVQSCWNAAASHSMLSQLRPLLQYSCSSTITKLASHCSCVTSTKVAKTK